jgi:hypothetical protein
MTLQHPALADELSRMPRWRRSFLLFFLGAALVAAMSACALGESEEPGCQTDIECGSERICRAGACFRIVGDVDASVAEDDAG